MKKKLLLGAAMGVALGILAGCDNVGNAPAGATTDQVKAEQEKQEPLQQIRNIMYSPVPQAQKDQQIKAIEDKYHVKREDAMKNLPAVKFSNDKPAEVPTGK